MKKQDNPALNNINLLFQQASDYFEKGHLDEAKIFAKRILKTSPGHADANHLLGLIAGKCGNFSLAASLISSAIQNNPREPIYHFHHGMALELCGQIDDAIAAYERAIKLKPKLVEAHHKIIAILQNRGRLEEALSAYNRMIRLKLDYAELHNNRAFVLWSLGRQEEALAACDQAIRLKPRYAGAYYNRGNALRGMSRLEEAVLAYKQAIQIKPDYADAYSNLGLVIKDMCLLEEAEEIYHRVLELEPTNAVAHSNLLFLMAARVKLSPAEMLEELRRWDYVHGQEGRMHSMPVRTLEPVLKRRMRVGYVSPDLRTHAVGYFFEPLLAAHDRSRFEIFCYDANAGNTDALTERLRGIAEHWRFVADKTDADLAKLILEDEIDILVDLAGHTSGNRLKTFTYRPAPVQATYLGFFAATGLEAMDYWITDEVVHPADTLEKTVEEIFRLSRCSLCYQPPAETPAVSPCPSMDDQVILGSFSDISKLTPEVVETWSHLLNELTGSRLLLTNRTLGERKTEKLLLGRFAHYNICTDQLMIQCNEQYEEWFATYAQVDIVLDPFPRTGCTTTAEALWMGVPVITLAGQRYVERASATILDAVGLNDLITSSREEYISKALMLARNPDRRVQLRSSLRAKMAHSQLCDGKGLARAMESAYRSMWKKLLNINS